VLFDLDDTLFEQSEWLAGAWDAVAHAAGLHGVDQQLFRSSLEHLAAAGTDKGRIIDRALERVGVSECPIDPLLAAFRSHRSKRLEPYAGVRESLRRLRERVPIAVITDGDPEIQRDKLSCLSLLDAFDAFVFSDEFGREHRKPDTLPFEFALSMLDLRPESVVVVGDRPSKDVAGALASGMRAVRVLTGEYRSLPDDPRAWVTVSDLVAAVTFIEPLTPLRSP
jgi:putative hydrolase of the HAD superfamily